MQADSADNERPFHAGHALAEAGYVPLVLRGKRPLLTGWTTRDGDELRAMACEAPSESNFGVRCGEPAGSGVVVGLDFDIDDEAAAKAVTDLLLPRRIPVRLGRPGRLLVVVRAPADTRSHDLKFAHGDGRECAVQVLAQGKQFVAFGVHPNTGKPYAWPDRSIVEIPPPELQPVADVDALVQWLMRRQGWQLSTRNGDAQLADVVPLRADVAMNDELMSRVLPDTNENVRRVRSALDAVPADCSYDEWRDIVFALLSTGWSCARAMAREWSRGAPEKFDEAAFAKLADSYRDRAGGVTIATLFHHAKAAGWIESKRLPIASSPFRLLTAAEVVSRPPLRWRVRGVLPAEGIGAIYGPPGSGKSFLLLDLLGSVAEGAEWFAHRVDPCPVVMAVNEGAAGLPQRMRAFAAKSGSLPAVRAVDQPFALTDEQQVDALSLAILAANAGGGIVVVDTLNGACPGLDENDSADMGRAIAGLKRLQAAVGGLVLAVHHSGKDQSRGLRGHSSLLAALDVAVEVTRDSDRRSWKIAKAKDGLDAEAHGFRLDVVDLGADADGEPVTSCVVVPEVGPVARRTAVSGVNQRMALDAVRRLAGASAHGTISVEAVIASVRNGSAIDPKRVGERVRDALNRLAAAGHLKITDGAVWIPPK